MTSDTTSNTTTRKLNAEILSITREIEKATSDEKRRKDVVEKIESDLKQSESRVEVVKNDLEQSISKVKVIEGDLKRERGEFTYISEKKANLTRKMSDLQRQLASEIRYLAEQAAKLERH